MPSTLLAVLALIVGAVSVVLMVAPRLARHLVRQRALGLPSDLGERMLEEWESELDHLGSGLAQLVFATHLFFTPRQALIDAATESDPFSTGAGAVVSVEDLRILPGVPDTNAAGVIDYWGMWLVPVGLAIAFSLHPLTVMLLAFAWNAVWVLCAHLVAVRLWGGTPGMLRAGIRVVTLDGSPLEWRHILARARVAFVVFVLMFPPLAGLALWLAVSWPRTGWWLVQLLWAVTLAQNYRRFRQGPTETSFDHRPSGTTLVMWIPHVTGRIERGPSRSTSLMR